MNEEVYFDTHEVLQINSDWLPLNKVKDNRKNIDEASKNPNKIKKITCADLLDYNGTTSLKTLKPFKNLVHFECHHEIKNETDALVELLKMNENLSELTINLGNLSNEDLEKIFNVLLFHKNLMLNISKIEVFQIRLLTDFLANGNLKGLRFRLPWTIKKVYIPEKEIEYLSNVVSKSNLQELHLSGNPIGHGATKYLSKMLELNCNLTILGIEYTDTNLDEIRESLKKNFVLKELKIGGCPKKDLELETTIISQLLKEANYLEVLHIGDVIINETFLEALSVSKVKHLMFGHHSAISEISKLAKVLKGLKSLTGFTWKPAFEPNLLDALKYIPQLKILSFDRSLENIDEELLYEYLMTIQSLTHLDIALFSPKNIESFAKIIASKKLKILNVNLKTLRQSNLIIDALDKNDSLLYFGFGEMNNVDENEKDEFRTMVEFYLKRNRMNAIGVFQHFKCFSNRLRDMEFKFES